MEGSASAQGGYGAASASLRDPSCTPGTAEYSAAKKENERILAAYRNCHAKLVANGAVKADMTASKEVKATVWPNPQARLGIYGHIPGVAVGDVFAGRAELGVLGLHTPALRGIDHRKGGASGAVAVVLSGGYKDNEDTGERFVYTGAGGQDPNTKKQVDDQSYDYADNAALILNWKTGTPVRVFRQKAGSPPSYTYEGLYTVVDHKQESSSDGPLVIRFTLQGVPGHFAVSGKVEFKRLARANAFRKRQLAGAEAEVKQQARKVPKGYVWCFVIPNMAVIARDIQHRAQSGRYGRLVSPDIADKQENVLIPVWNAFDDQDTMYVASNMTRLPLDDAVDLNFEYMSEYEFTKGDEAAVLTKKAHEHFQKDCGINCGIQFHGGECPYNSEGLLMNTHVTGVMECPKNCKGNLCKLNRVVAQGIRYPLEIFKVPGKGWGVRCSVDLPAGAVLCKYTGVVITDNTAEEQTGADTYFYDLDHFHQLEEEEERLGERDEHRNPNLPLMPKEFRDKHLTVDASHEGNVARFFNHSCDPNCTMQAVFTGAARSHELHYMVIVASEDIPKFTELTYSYGHGFVMEGDDEQTAAAAAAGGAATVSARPRIPCNCGAANCRGWMKN